MDLYWLVFIICFTITFGSCSRYNHHFEILFENGLAQLKREDPVKMAIYETEIIPWLKSHLSESEIASLDFETINRRGNKIPDRPIFKDRKLLFELAQLSIEKGLNELGSEVLQFIRSRLFYSSTYSVLIASLNVADLDDLIIFNQVLKLWFPEAIDIIAAISNIVNLQMGEDETIVLIDIVWNDLVKNLNSDILYFHFSFILRTAMRNNYVSVFEDILERFPTMIHFTNSRLKSESDRLVSGRGRQNRGTCGTIVHEFCNNLSPPPSYLDSIPFDHRIRVYPTVNFDLLNLMKLHGADIEAPDRKGMTPLHYAIYIKNHHIVDVLLRSGANYRASFSKYSMKEWIRRYHDKEVEKVFKIFFEELKQEAQPNEHENQNKKDFY